MSIRASIGENALYLRDELERNYVCVQVGDYEARRENIEAMPNDTLSRGELFLLKTALDHPVAVEKLLRLKIDGTDLSYAGAGTESTAVTDGEVVQKIHRKSVHWPEKIRRSKAQEDRDGHSAMGFYMQEFVVRQDTNVEDHPLRPGKRAVVTTQPYFDFVPTGIFPPYEPSIDECCVEDLKDEYPGIVHALGRFAIGGLRMHEETSMLIDTSGFNNIVMAERDGEMRLTCLDGTPVKQNNTSVAERIVGQLTALRDYVAE